MPTPVTGLLALLLLSADSPAYKLETADAKRVEAVLTYQVHVPGLVATDWFVVAARLPELPCQVQVKTKMEPSGVARTELSSMRRPIVIAQLPARGAGREKGFQVRITYQATLRSRKLVPLPPGDRTPAVPLLRADERQTYLSATQTIDFKARDVQKWLDENGLRRRKGESDIDFARRVFVCIRDTFTYRWPTGNDGKASTSCRAGRGDCGSYSVVFVSALRANGVPARLLVGRWAESARPPGRRGEAPSFQAHVKAEFFAEGVGWVPVDVTRAQEDRSPGRLRFFGYDPGDFLVQNVDYDLVVDPPRFGRKHLIQLQNIAYWGSGGGSWDGQTMREDWQVRPLPLR